MHQAEAPELDAERFNKMSPVSYAMTVANRENLPYVLAQHGAKLRLYPVRLGVGVGRRGPSETYIEVHTGLLKDDDAGYLWLLFSAEALTEGGTLGWLIDESRRFAGDLAERLRLRIYGEVVPRLAEGLAGARGLRKPKAKELAETYEMAMMVLFRLLFIAYGEDKDLLLRLRGPFASLERFKRGAERPPAEFTSEEVSSWTDAASLPLLPTEESLEIFTQFRKAPRLDLNDGRSWRARPHTELHATNDKELMDLKSEDRPRGFWPVFKGESFDIWQPDTGRYYAWADSKTVLPVLQETRQRGNRNRKSPFYEFEGSCLRDPKTLPCHSPRIAFRDVSRATDSRTVRVALVPPKVFIAHLAPYFLWPRGDQRDETYLLGALSSIPLDWYPRRFVGTHLTFFVINPFPIPRPERTDALWQRVVALAGRLACPDDRFARWAEAVGVECGPLEQAEKDDHIHELDAVVAHLYGLEEKHLVHIFETFHEGWDYEERLKATRKHYWEGKAKR